MRICVRRFPDLAYLTLLAHARRHLNNLALRREVLAFTFTLSRMKWRKPRIHRTNGNSAIRSAPASCPCPGQVSMPLIKIVPISEERGDGGGPPGDRLKWGYSTILVAERPPPSEPPRLNRAVAVRSKWAYPAHRFVRKSPPN